MTESNRRFGLGVGGAAPEMTLLPPTCLSFACVLSILATLTTVACNENVPDYFPLKKGQSWTYEIVMEGVRGHEVQKSFVTNLGSLNLDGQVLSARLLHNGQTHYYKNKADGLARVATKKPEDELYWEAAPSYLFHYPLVPSTGWHQEEKTFLLQLRLFNADVNAKIPMLMYYRIESMDETVKVPAGVFTDCMKVTGRGKTSIRGRFSEGFIELTVETLDYFAPGVGLVKSERLETSSHPRLEGGEYVKELQDYSAPWPSSWW